jgi:hypothetical protein
MAYGRIGLALATLVLAAAGPARAAGSGIGAPGLDDPLFPLAGNGGYDVAHYGLALAYDRASGQLDGTAVISARATQSLTRFDLDLRGFDISLLLVDGRRAAYRRSGQELIITPRDPLKKGRDFTVIVRYAGVPAVITDPDESIEGWVPTADGAFVVGEPQGRRGGSRPTTTRRTRRPSTRPSRFPTASPRWATASSPGASRTAGTRPGCGTRATRWRPTSRRRPTGASR